MKKTTLCIALAMFLAASCNLQQIKPVDCVDPFIGTGAHGHTFPGAASPFGMVQLSPDTRNSGWDGCSCYHYSDNVMYGFSHTHLSGTGCADLADFLFCPFIGFDAEHPFHAFSHDNETACPGYYSVEFSDQAIKAELTALPRTGVHRYSFAAQGPRQILIDLEWNTGEQITTETKVFTAENGRFECKHVNNGWIMDHTSFLSAVFSPEFINVTDLGGGCYLLDFAEDTDVIEVAAGLSLTSVEAAAANREADIAEPSFDSALEAATSLWEQSLGSFEVKGGTKDDVVNFYTALYHTMICPNLISDAGAPERYSTLSIWDTYRAWNPLFTLTDRTFVSNLVGGLLEFYERNGELPIWPLCDIETRCMIGYHSVSIIADAYLRGIGGFDPEKALEAMVVSSNINAKASDKYLEYGYVPADLKRESVSLTLEYAYDDWCIARMAEAMGKADIAAEYYRRAGNYINVMDGGTMFFRGKNANGTWAQPFDKYASDRAFTEAIPWQYRFGVPHDIAGLKTLYGGDEALAQALDNMFSDTTEPIGEISDMTGLVGQYAHGNEPSHHVAYLYDFLGQPWKTQKTVKSLMKTMYQPTPEGICGNEDCGQMSAWFVLSAAGFYPVCPGSGEYCLGSPLFKEMKIKLSCGKTLTVKCDHPGLSYVRRVTLNGQEIKTAYITYDQIMGGGELCFQMCLSPYKKRACDPALAPYSMTSKKVAAIPYTTTPNVFLFEGSVDVDLNTLTPDAEIRYTLDGTEPDAASTLYTEPIHMDGSGVIKARSFLGCEGGRTLTIDAVRADYAPSVKVSGLKQGLSYEYYTGQFTQCSHIAGGKLVERGVMSYPTIKDAPDADHFAYVFRGYIDIPSDGVWEFATVSDDGSLLEIDGRVIVDNDGSHGSDLASGKCALAGGLHTLCVKYFEDYEGEEFDMLWKDAGQFTRIPESILFCK